MPRICCFLLFCALTGPGLLYAQKDETSFYTRMGQADGLFEQRMRFTDAQDEWDYWKDQRAFEKSLEGQKPRAHRIYIRAKRGVYASHHCLPACNHGDYYWLQASYYAQMTGDTKGLATVVNRRY
ncbi:hypothetical protein OZ410_02780 [Robiginitalea sp. M366]|uniref:hypothetical protein n=1 Tax=Robiginitalea aestuariiviva TaxID=3036903 RepID=UPI00240E0A66|nr:hypothetical protein [Robiginitalea aestuariiviva]MDG1571224.1 hypothetical protein [Robiginitalea aestuariiviva]